MSSFTLPVDTPLDEYLTDTDTLYETQDSINDLKLLLSYPLQGGEKLGKKISKFNGAIRVDITKIVEPRIIRSPTKFLKILKLLQFESNIIPSYGLKIKKGSRFDYVHYVLDLTENASVGVFFFDSKRLLSVPQVHNVERLIKAAGLKGAIIIANHVGIPAKQEAQRINNEHGGFGILTIEHFDSMAKRFEENNY